jgi:hypothetical protein
VGEAATRSNSALRYSERETPSRAARASSVRCTSSGTSRTWTGIMVAYDAYEIVGSGAAMAERFICSKHRNTSTCGRSP